MNSVHRLVEIVVSAWTKCLPPPYGTGEYSSAVDGMTDCNRFVYDVLSRFGYKKFWDDELKCPMLANRMFDELKESEDWMQVSGDVAQVHANMGVVVVAAWKDLTGGHGHVCIIMPGTAEPSGTWGVVEPKVPKVANVGAPDKCRIDRKASFAFSADKQPLYFAKKDMMS